jgi:hypothetical protein
MEKVMKKLLLIAALALVSSSALAQSDQGQAGAKNGTTGNPAATASDPAKPDGMRDGIREGATTGMSSGQTENPNGSPAAPPKSTTGPVGSPSKAETPPR